MNRSVYLVLLRNVNVNVETGCWEWIGSLRTDGYGQVYMSGKSIRAHRLSYEYYISPIAPGMQIDHKCGVRCCVNPEHLQQVTHCENMNLAVERKENFQSSKTHCKHGHEFSEANTRISKRSNGRTFRRCKVCGY